MDGPNFWNTKKCIYNVRISFIKVRYQISVKQWGYKKVSNKQNNFILLFLFMYLLRGKLSPHTEFSLWMLIKTGNLLQNLPSDYVNQMQLSRTDRQIFYLRP